MPTNPIDPRKPFPNPSPVTSKSRSELAKETQRIALDSANAKNALISDLGNRTASIAVDAAGVNNAITSQLADRQKQIFNGVVDTHARIVGNLKVDTAQFASDLNNVTNQIAADMIDNRPRTGDKPPGSLNPPLDNPVDNAPGDGRKPPSSLLPPENVPPDNPPDNGSKPPGSLLPPEGNPDLSDAGKPCVGMDGTQVIYRDGAGNPLGLVCGNWGCILSPTDGWMLVYTVLSQVPTGGVSDTGPSWYFHPGDNIPSSVTVANFASHPFYAGIIVDTFPPPADILSQCGGNNQPGPSCPPPDPCERPQQIIIANPQDICPNGNDDNKPADFNPPKGGGEGEDPLAIQIDAGGFNPDKDWCDYLRELRARLEQIGQAIVKFAGSKDKVDVGRVVVARILNATSPGSLMVDDDVILQFDNIINRLNADGTLHSYITILDAKLDEGRKGQTYLMILRQVLLAYAGSQATSNVNDSGGHNAELKVSGAIGQGGKFGPSFFSVIVGGGVAGTETGMGGFNNNEGIGLSFRPIVVPLLELLDFLIASEVTWRLPVIPEIREQYLRGIITRSQYQCRVEMYGHNFDEEEQTAKALAQRHSTTQAIGLWHRGKLVGEDFTNYMRHIGWLNQEEVSSQIQLSYYLPSPHDLIRFMVRDVDDAKIVDKFNLDEDFADKFSGLTKKWATDQAVTDDVALREWRAHWRTPGDTSLADGLWRLRPNSELANRVGLTVTSQDVRETLAYNDLIPFWRERFLALMENPLTRIDARRAYLNGSIDATQLKSTFLDIGYSSLNADRMVNFVAKDRINHLQSLYPAKAFAAGAFSEIQAKFGLQSWGITDNEWEEVKYRILVAQKEQTAKICVKSLTKRYLIGDFTNDQFRIALINFGIDPAIAMEKARQAECQRQTQYKLPPLFQLCRMHGAGLISSAELEIRMMRLGYEPADAARLAMLCVQTNQQAKQKKDDSGKKAADKAAKDQAAKAAKAAADAGKAITSAANTAAKEAKEIARRSRRIRKAADTLSEALGQSPELWAERITAAIDARLSLWPEGYPIAEGIVLDAVDMVHDALYPSFDEALKAADKEQQDIMAVVTEDI